MHRFRFTATWTDLPADAGSIYATLADVEGYPLWWPQVIGARRVDECSGWVTLRSVLPVNLHVQLTVTTEQADAAVLEARLDGDLIGWSRWVCRDGAASYSQECVLSKPGLRHVAGPCALALRSNHAAMMRSGEQGLRAHLREGSAPALRVS